MFWGSRAPWGRSEDRCDGAGSEADGAKPPVKPGHEMPVLGVLVFVGAGNESLGWTAAQTAAAKSIEVGQISINSPSYSNAESGVGSLDVNISQQDSLRARFILNRDGFIDTAAELPIFYQTVPSNSYLATVSEFHTFSPALINEFRFGYNRYSNSYPAGDYKWPGLD